MKSLPVMNTLFYHRFSPSYLHIMYCKYSCPRVAREGWRGEAGAGVRGEDWGCRSWMDLLNEWVMYVEWSVI